MAEDKDKEKIAVIKSILSLHPRDGATIDQIRREYKEQEGEELENSREVAIAYMWRIKDVRIDKGRYYSHSRESEHIQKLVQEQRQAPKRRASCYFDRDRGSDGDAYQRNWAPRGRSPTRSSRWSDDRAGSRSIGRPSTSNGFQNHSYTARTRAPSPTPTRNNSRPLNEVQPLLSVSTRDPRINGHSDRETGKTNDTLSKQTAATHPDVQFQRFAIIADDFLFNLILERVFFSQDEVDNFERVLEPKWSYCVVGQSIADAVTLVKTKNFDETNAIPLEPIRVIVNIGAADICRGRTFREMATDFMELIETCTKLNMEPTITTIMPFGATGNAEEIAWKAHSFNNFLQENFENVIDVWSCFTIGMSRLLGLQFQLNGQSTRTSGLKTDITWERDIEEMSLQHRGKA